MENGELLRSNPSLQDIRDRFSNNFSLLDEKYKSIRDTVAYPVKLSRRLKELQESVRAY